LDVNLNINNKNQDCKTGTVYLWWWVEGDEWVGVEALAGMGSVKEGD
jgi:hypothetical protein